MGSKTIKTEVSDDGWPLFKRTIMAVHVCFSPKLNKATNTKKNKLAINSLDYSSGKKTNIA